VEAAQGGGGDGVGDHVGGVHLLYQASDSIFFLSASKSLFKGNWHESVRRSTPSPEP
jgi:hypothetical protein